MSSNRTPYEQLYVVALRIQGENWVGPGGCCSGLYLSKVPCNAYLQAGVNPAMLVICIIMLQIRETVQAVKVKLKEDKLKSRCVQTTVSRNRGVVDLMIKSLMVAWFICSTGISCYPPQYPILPP